MCQICQMHDDFVHQLKHRPNIWMLLDVESVTSDMSGVNEATIFRLVLIGMSDTSNVSDTDNATLF
jgi:hypothetical protein